MQHNKQQSTPDWEPRPPSDAPVTEYTGPDGKILRLDMMGRILCHATRRDGNLCKSPAVTGMKVCRMHGGSTPQAKRGAALRLAQLVNPAIGVLAKEMVQAEKSVDRQRAANSILDRAGHGRHQVIEASDAKDLLLQGLLDLKQRQDVSAEDSSGDDAS